MKKGLVVAVCVLVLALVVLGFYGTRAEAQVAVSDDGLIVITTMYDAQEKIVVYHKETASLLMYGHTSAGLQLQQVRRLAKDFEFAGKVKEVPYSKRGYTTDKIDKALKDADKRIND
jgi:hypothetical protein